MLSGAGPLRTKMLDTLYKDARCKNKEFKERGIYTILEKMGQGYIIYAQDLIEFSELLMAHQQAILADGATVLDRSVMEHNLLAVSNLYVNISFQQLGLLLSISASQAEHVASAMVSDGRYNYFD